METLIQKKNQYYRGNSLHYSQKRNQSTEMNRTRKTSSKIWKYVIFHNRVPTTVSVTRRASSALCMRDKKQNNVPVNGRSPLASSPGLAPYAHGLMSEDPFRSQSHQCALLLEKVITILNLNPENRISNSDIF